jgi:hypothetical protein
VTVHTLTYHEPDGCCADGAPLPHKASGYADAPDLDTALDRAHALAKTHRVNVYVDWSRRISWLVSARGSQQQYVGPRPVRQKPELDTTQYEWTYGHLPRGRGSWAFRFSAGGRPLGGDDDRHEPGLEWARPDGVTCGNTLYTAARRWALRRARDLGADRVEVCT